MRLCFQCGAPAVTLRGKAVCADHKGKRPLVQRECTCGRQFTTRGGNQTCPSCAHAAAKHPCADCGVAVDKRAEVCRACWGKRHTGEASPAWKGGRTRHKQNGYVRIKTPGHPCAGADGYVREHVLVMEQMLGRYLLPGENVHHRNGVRDDNRPENLELWVVFQPAGQRAVDLLAWAREIEARYGPVESELAVRPSPKPGALTSVRPTRR